MKRIVASDPGQGSGTRLLGQALDWLYTETETNRVDLDLFVENERARRAYEKLGFIVEGRLRDYHRSVDGRIRDALIMSILPQGLGQAPPPVAVENPAPCAPLSGRDAPARPGRSA